MIFGSVCSGIEAASVAWEPLGWKAAWLAEIEPFASALLAERWPDAPNLGDFTKIGGDVGPIDLLVGGTPCQSFSVAGLRAGLDDPRGNLTLEFLALAGRVRPRWILWENVPGVLSDDGGRTFGTVLGLLGQLGYGFAYRVLDAQHFGVPQRRRRVFVVGYLGDWRPAAAVLFEPACLRGDSPSRREAREGVALPLGARVDRGGSHREAEGNNLIAGTLGGGSRSHGWDSDTDRMTFIAPTLRANGGQGSRQDQQPLTVVTHSLRADGFDASEDGTGRGTPLVADPISANEGRTYSQRGRQQLPPPQLRRRFDRAAIDARGM